MALQTPAAVTTAEVATGARRTPRLVRPTTWAALAFVAPLVAYLTVFYAYPLYENASMSLHRFTRATYVTGKAPFVGLDIYREVLASSQFWPGNLFRAPLSSV